MSAPGQEPSGAAPEGAAPESTTSGPDYGPVMDRLSELAGTVGQLHEGFQQFQQAQPQPEAEPDPWTQLFGEPEPQVEPEQQQPQMDPNALQGAINHAIQQANAPLQQQLQALQMERATAQLYQQIPQLADKPENAEIRQQTAARVQQSLASYAPEVAQVLSNDPAYIATIFKAAEAENAARAQVPAGGDVPSLEAAGGAHPGGNGEQANPIDQIYANRDQTIPQGFR